MEIYIDGINGIENFNFNLTKFTIIGGINSTRKSTILEIVDFMLELYYLREKEIIFDYLEENKWKQKSLLLEMDKINLQYNYEELLMTETLTDLSKKLNANSSALKKFLELDNNTYSNTFVTDTDLQTIDEDKIIKMYLDQKKMELNYSFGEKATISLRDDNSDKEYIVFKKEKEKVSLVYEDAKRVLTKNEIFKNDVTYRRNFDNTSFNSVWTYEDDRSLLKNFEELNFEIERDSDNGRYYILENGNRFSAEKSASGMKVFIFLENLYRGSLLFENDWIILDEPDVHLHPQLQKTFINLIKYISEELNVNIIMSTHNSLTVEGALNIENSQVLLMQENNGVITSKVCSNDFAYNELLDNLGEVYYGNLSKM